MGEHFEDRVVVSGIGQSAVGRRLNRSELELTVDACIEAVADAGLELADIDGLVAWPGDVGSTGGLTAPYPGFCGPSTVTVKDMLRLELNWYFAGPEGPGQLGAVANAAMAVATGMCRHVLVYRTLTESTAQGASSRPGLPKPDEGITGIPQWILPFGAISGANWSAPYAQRHFYEFGTTREQLGAVAINARRNAGLNPRAVYREPLSMDEYLGSRMISSPLCLFDCDVPVDGSTAVVVSTAEYAADARSHAIRLQAFGTALNGRASWDQWSDMTTMAAHDAGSHMWRRTDLTPADVDVVQLYDGFTILMLMWLEGLSFCPHGESGAFVEGGRRIALEGELPANTSGGQLSAGRLHGFGLLHEAVLQLRGDATGRQIRDAEVAVAAAGAGPLAGCMLLSR
jgi:acetyl-CoA acetyltransferase